MRLASFLIVLYCLSLSFSSGCYAVGGSFLSPNSSSLVSDSSEEFESNTPSVVNHYYLPWYSWIGEFVAVFVIYLLRKERKLNR